MKKVLEFIVIALVVYLGTAFVYGTLNSIEWGIGGRVLCVFFFALAAWFYLGYALFKNP